MLEISGFFSFLRMVSRSDFSHERLPPPSNAYESAD